MRMGDILIIEHDLATTDSLTQALQEQGYTVATAPTGEAGLALAETLTPSVIICDWSMPGKLDGLTLFQRLKANPRLSTTFFLLLASHQSTTDRVKVLEMGADDLLSWPIDANELKARVRAGLRLNQLARDLQEQKQRLEAELAEAEAYVRSLLPPDTTGRVPIQARFLPSQQLGGDCYDYYWLDPDYLVMYLLDVSGHGLGSALLSTSVLNVLRSQSLPDVNFYRPEKVLHALNETFQMSDQNQKYFTIWYGVLNCSNRQLLYASAGHPPAIVLSQSESGQTVSQLRTQGLPIGMMPDIQYQWRRYELPPQSTLYLFSDGLYEVMGENNEILGLEGFIDYLCKGPRHRSVDEIMETMNNLRAANTITDDMSLVGLTLN